MNENKTPVIIKEKEEILNCVCDEIKVKQRDSSSSVIAAISVFVLIFSVILAIAVILLNSDTLFSKEPDVTSGYPTVTPPDKVQSSIENNRDKPSLPSHTNAVEDVSAYRPKDSATAEDIVDASSAAALLVDLSSGTVVAQKELDTPVQIASMTKVMTLIVACDYITSPEMLYAAVDIKYSDRLVGYNKVFVNENHSVKEESVYVVDLLYGLILFSGADCAYGLAEGFAGSEAEFVAKMNEKAKAIGMNDTSFTNCVGKDDGGANVSTVRDTATMLTYALKNPLCRAILSESRWACVGKYDLPTKLYGGKIPSSVHEKINKTCGDVKVLGGKSGNEDLAGYCLVSFGANSSGKEYVCVTAGHKSSSYTDTEMIYTNYAD